MPVVDEEGVLLVMLDDVVNGGEGEGSHGILPVGRGVNVEMLAAA